MKRIFFLGLAFCALGAFAQTSLLSGIDLKNLDTRSSPATTSTTMLPADGSNRTRSMPSTQRTAPCGPAGAEPETHPGDHPRICLEAAAERLIGTEDRLSLQPHDGLRAPQQAAPPSSSLPPTTKTSTIKLFTYDRPHRQIQQSFRWREKAFYAQALLRQ